MKKSLVILIIIISLAGCTSFDNAIASMNNAVSDLGKSSTNGIRLNPMFEFTMFYAAYFTLGGYGFGDDNFKDGEGVTWNIVNDNEGNELTVTRALLKKTTDGDEWWFLSAPVEDEVRFYEMLIDSNQNILKIRYKDNKSGLIEEIIPEQSEEPQEKQSLADRESYASYITGQETVKTKAGSFKTDHLVFEDDGQDKSSQYKYEYWLSDKIPGHCVKYVYENITDKETIRGEVIDIRGGYKTQLDSY